MVEVLICGMVYDTASDELTAGAMKNALEGHRLEERDNKGRLYEKDLHQCPCP